MSQLVLKLLIHSYCRYHQQTTFLQDCLQAISNSTNMLSTKIHSQTTQIKQTLNLPLSCTEQQQMSIIMQQQTERSVVSERVGMGYRRWMEKIRGEFDGEVRRVRRIQGQVQGLLDVYKGELKSLSKEVTKLVYKIQEYKKENARLLQENNQLKDQIANQTAQIFMNENSDDIDSVFDVKAKATGKFGYQQKQQPPTKFKLKNPQKPKKQPQPQSSQPSQHQHQQPKRKQSSTSTPPSQQPQKQQKQKPKPTEKQSQYQMGRKQEHSSIQVSIRDRDRERERDRQCEEDNQKWKKLAKKIEELKGKLVAYQEEIEEKDAEIAKLKSTIKQLKLAQAAQQQQKRKLKTANTTLRGEKTILQNQLQSLKKTLSQKTQLSQIHQSQCTTLKSQIQSLSQSLKQQTETINDLRQSLTRESSKEVLEYRARVDKLTRFNEELVRFIGNQEREVQDIFRKCGQVQDLLDGKVGGLMGRIGELEMILDQKNQCIVRMKSKGAGTENLNPNTTTNNNNNNAYLSELVRVLTKKVADRDEIIRRLEQTR